MFDQYLHPLHCHTLSHISDPLNYVTHLGPPIFSSTKNQDTKLAVENISKLKIFARGFCPGRVCLEGFVWDWFSPFSLLSEYIRCNRELNITFNFRFHIMIKY